MTEEAAGQREETGRSTSVGTGRLTLWIGVFVLLGAPLLFFVWRFVNEILSGRFTGSHALVAAAGLGGLLALLWLVARSVRRWEGG